MLPDLPDAINLDAFTAWTSLFGTSASFLGNAELLALLAVDPTTITVEDYLALLDEAESSLAAEDFSIFATLGPQIEAAIRAAFETTDPPGGVTVDEFIDQIFGLLDELTLGDLSFITANFAALRALLVDADATLTLAEVLSEGGGPVVDPDIPGFLELLIPGLPELLTLGWVSGDPHLQTLDGVGYDFQAAGEFVLLQSADAGDFMLQARMVQAGPNVSANEAVATNLDGQAVMIDAAHVDPLFIEGVATVLADGDSVEVGNGAVFRDGDTYAIVYPGSDGVLNDGDSQVLVRVQGSGRVDLDVRLNAELLGTLEGLLGDGDGDSANDLARADGTLLAQPLTFEDLYGQYRDDWRVDSINESLFTYDAGETLEGFYDAGFPAALVSLDTLDAAVREVAEEFAETAGLTPGTSAFERAVLDFALTGDASFVTSALETPLAEVGTIFSETLNGGPGADVLDGRAGFDLINGNGGNDVLMGAAGNDTLNGGEGDDQILGGFGFDSVVGGSGNDNLDGSNGFDTLIGGSGNDLLDGDFGNDMLDGGAGNDTLLGGLGFDELMGGEDDDFLQARDGFDTLLGGSGDDTLEGNNGNDSLSGEDGNDELIGGLGSDVVSGGAGDDSLRGSDGFDILNGDAGNDDLQGNAGNDTINGGADDDTMQGGLGADTFIFGDGADRIVGFRPVDSVEIEAALLTEATPVVEDLRDYAGLDGDGNLVLDFGNGNSLTFENVRSIDTIIDDVTLI